MHCGRHSLVTKGNKIFAKTALNCTDESTPVPGSENLETSNPLIIRVLRRLCPALSRHVQKMKMAALLGLEPTIRALIIRGLRRLTHK